MSFENTETQNHMLSKEAVTEKLQMLLKDLLKLEDTQLITLDTHLQEELGIESLEMVDMIIAVENAFSIKFPSSTNYEKVRTLGDVANLILERLQVSA